MCLKTDFETTVVIKCLCTGCRKLFVTCSIFFGMFSSYIKSEIKKSTARVLEVSHIFYPTSRHNLFF